MQKASLRQVLLPPRVSARSNNTYFWNLRLKLESHVFSSQTFNSCTQTSRHSQVFKYLYLGLEFVFLVYWSSDMMWKPRYKHKKFYTIIGKWIQKFEKVSKKFQKILDQFFFLRSNHILREKNKIWLAKHSKKKFNLFFS